MFSLVTQRRPRRAETPQEELLLAMTTPVEAVAKLVPGVPPEIAHVIDKALALEMDARWQDARAMQTALREARRAIEARGQDLTLPMPFGVTAFAPVPNTIQIGDPSSAPLVPRPKLTPPPKSSPSGQTPSPAIMSGSGDPLTTGRAFLQSQAPPPPKHGRGGLAVGLVLGVLGIGILGLAASHYLGAGSPTTLHPTTASSPPPPRTDPIPPPEPAPDKTVAATDPAPPSTGSSRPPTPSTRPPTSAIGRPPPPPGSIHRPPPPPGGKSTDPFDQRF
jgi:serine/threonine-protein kinase